MSGIRIKIDIAGRQYPLTVKPEEEVTLRKAGKEINQMIKDFEKKFAISDKQDVLAMICLQLNGKCTKLQKEKGTDSSFVEERLGRLTRILDKQLSEN